MATISIPGGINNGLGKGGVNNPGSPSGLRPQTKIRIEQIARYRLASVNNKRIAELVGMTPAGLAALLQLPEYKETEEALLIGHVTKMDEALAGKIDPIRNELRNGVPSAVRCLLEVVNQRRDLKAALAAAGELLDRDPDKALPKRTAKQEEAELPSIPDGIFDNACKEGDKIAAIPVKPALEEESK